MLTMTCANSNQPFSLTFRLDKTYKTTKGLKIPKVNKAVSPTCSIDCCDNIIVFVVQAKSNATANSKIGKLLGRGIYV